ncbi:MAG: hypothetical protein IPK62_15615 [Bacteroidetes bacterium]|nr:hypothetical protein [Bacteroidota bacterium]
MLTSYKHPDYKTIVQNETLNQLQSLSCEQYYNGYLFEKFYRHFVKMGMKPISTLAAEIADKILHSSPPLPPLEDEK